MITGYRHTGFVVRNLERTRAFYENVLGFTVWKQAVESGQFIEQVVGIPGVVLEWVKLKAPDNSLIELLQYRSHPEDETRFTIQPANTPGCPHIAFTVTDIERIYRTLSEYGVYCNSKPQKSPDGMVKVLYCHDPDGITIEMVEECLQKN